MKEKIIENLVRRLRDKLINERKSDELSLKISRLIIRQFKNKEDFEVKGIRFDRGDDYASFDLYCSFIEEEDYNEPFSISAEADMDVCVLCNSSHGQCRSVYQHCRYLFPLLALFGCSLGVLFGRQEST